MEQNNEASLSLLESTATEVPAQTEREHFELKCRLRLLESENAELKRIQPRLLDVQGKDFTVEIAKLHKELLASTDKHDKLESEHRKLMKKHNELEKNAMDQIDLCDKEIAQIKRKALELEEENTLLREQIQDEKSRIHHLQQAALMEQSLNEIQMRGHVQDSLQKIHGSAAAQLNESFGGEIDIKDAEQIATHMLMIIEKLDKNRNDSEELRTAIIAFMAERGFTLDSSKSTAFYKICKEMANKRQQEIRVANDGLQQKVNAGEDDQDFDGYMRQLCQESMMSLSNTHPSLAFALANQQQHEMSVLGDEHGNQQEDMLNMTVESVAALNLTARTSNLAEACLQMFDKLRGTADFFQHLLKTLGVTEDEDGQDMMRKIESLKLDLDKSMGQARSIVLETKIAQKNFRSIVFEQSQLMNSTACSVFNESKLMDTAAAVATSAIAMDQEDEIQQQPEECQKCVEIQAEKETFKEALDKALENKQELEKKCDELEEEVKQLMEEKEQLSSAVKENKLPREQMVSSIREELTKIHDTMSFVSSTVTATTSAAKKRVSKRNGSSSKKEAQQPQSSSNSKPKQ